MLPQLEVRATLWRQRHSELHHCFLLQAVRRLQVQRLKLLGSENQVSQYSQASGLLRHIAGLKQLILHSWHFEASEPELWPRARHQNFTGQLTSFTLQGKPP